MYGRHIQRLFQTVRSVCKGSKRDGIQTHHHLHSPIRTRHIVGSFRVEELRRSRGGVMECSITPKRRSTRNAVRRRTEIPNRKEDKMGKETEYIKRSDAIMAITRAKLPDKTPEGIPIANGKRSVTDCVRRIKAIRAEDVVPVRHGRWVKVRGSWCTPGGDPVWECSECGKGVHVYGIEHGTYGKDVAEGQWVACPNCGAKMEDST